jgi:hypothetical protein
VDERHGNILGNKSGMSEQAVSCKQVSGKYKTKKQIKLSHKIKKILKEKNK